jgi:hypothetical protein
MPTLDDNPDDGQDHRTHDCSIALTHHGAEYDAS